MLTYTKNPDGTVFLHATQPPSVVNMAAAGTIGTRLDESDLIALLAVVRAEPWESTTDKLTATREQLAGER